MNKELPNTLPMKFQLKGYYSPGVVMIIKMDYDKIKNMKIL